MEKESKLEMMSGNIISQTALSLIAASSGSYFAPLLPALSNSLAASRHKKRIESAINSIETQISQLETKVNNMTEAQYKLINESIITLFQTLDDEKVESLKMVAINSVHEVDLKSYEAEIISRIMRDISHEEIKYLLTNYHYKKICIISDGQVKDDTDDIKFVTSEDEDAILVNGLVQIGILTLPTSGWGGTVNYVFSSICGKLIALLRENSTKFNDT